MRKNSRSRPRSLRAKPDRLSHAEAAALALTGITAIWAIEDTAQLQRGETILIQGGAGGVAGFAIQLAKYLGASVITTASAANAEYVRSLGADRVIDYNSEDFTKTVSGCDVVFDTVGDDVQVRSYDCVEAWRATGLGGPRAGRIQAVAHGRESVASGRVARIVRTWNGLSHCWTPGQWRRRRSLYTSRRSGRGAPCQRSTSSARQTGICGALSDDGYAAGPNSTAEILRVDKRA